MKLTKASSIEPAAIEWLWPGRIPLRALSIIEGEPGTSKSTLTCEIAARVSNGTPWPDGGSCPTGKGIICNAEDPEKEVIAPRLIAAGAKLDDVIVILPDDEVGGTEFTIPDHVEGLEQKIRNENVKVVVFDPVVAFLSVKVNNVSDHHIRRAYRCLENLAKRCGCSVIIVRHLTKDTTKSPKSRGSGSIGIMGAARASILVSEDASEKGRCLMVPNKGNWSSQRNGLSYRVVTHEIPLANGEVINTSRIEWLGETNLTALDILGSQVDLETAVATSDAVEFVRRALSNGPIDTNVLTKEGVREGHDRRAIYQAAKLLGVIKEFHDGKWMWKLG